MKCLPLRMDEGTRHDRNAIHETLMTDYKDLVTSSSSGLNMRSDHTVVKPCPCRCSPHSLLCRSLEILSCASSSSRQSADISDVACTVLRQSGSELSISPGCCCAIRVISVSASLCSSPIRVSALHLHFSFVKGYFTRLHRIN